MIIALLWLALNGAGICVESSFLPKAISSDDYLGNKWWPPIEGSEEIHKRSKRLIVPRQDESISSNIATLETTPQTLTEPKKKVKNSKKKDGLNGKDESGKPHKIYQGPNKKTKKPGKGKKTNPVFLRQGQSPKRLRQHMQHKKKVKQFLQKRIQEQIEQRNQNPSVFT